MTSAKKEVVTLARIDNLSLPPSHARRVFPCRLLKSSRRTDTKLPGTRLVLSVFVRVSSGFISATPSLFFPSFPAGDDESPPTLQANPPQAPRGHPPLLRPLGGQSRGSVGQGDQEPQRTLLPGGRDHGDCGEPRSQLRQVQGADVPEEVQAAKGECDFSHCLCR